MKTLLQFTTQLAQETGELLLEYYQNPDIKASLKADKTLITEADLAADQYISEAIQAQYRDDHILSEEMDTTYPDLAPNTWVIDPIDGTTNFRQGVHYWGVSIALVVDGWPNVGAVYFPVINELYSAQKGEGAFLNGEAISVNTEMKNRPVSLFICDSRFYKHYHATIPFKARILGAAAYNFCGIGHGVSILGFESTPKIWDIAASWLIIQESGGVVQPYGADPLPSFPRKGLRGSHFPHIGCQQPRIA